MEVEDTQIILISRITMRVEGGDADKLLMSPECILILVAFQVNAIIISPFVYNLSSNPESL